MIRPVHAEDVVAICHIGGDEHAVAEQREALGQIGEEAAGERRFAVQLQKLWQAPIDPTQATLEPQQQPMRDSEHPRYLTRQG